MPRKPKRETIQCRYFKWTMGTRNGVYQADGRSNRLNVGRHSLDTRDRLEARAFLEELDKVKAIEFGLIEEAEPQDSSATPLALKAGVDAYQSHLVRPAIAGGTTLSSRQRYKSILNKFVAYAINRGITEWQEVTRAVLMAYLTHLEGSDYAERTIRTEAVVINQLMRWAIAEKHLPAECKISLPLSRPIGTTTYCWSPTEVETMLGHCRKTSNLAWLGLLILVLSRTELRISEAIALRWQDIDFDRNIIHVVNDRRGSVGSQTPKRRTKNKKDRWSPMPDDLRQALLQGCQSWKGRVDHGPQGEVLNADSVRLIFIREVINPLKQLFPTAADERGFEHGRLHSFRHYFCSQCANQDVPERMVMKWLGHKDSAMIQIYYRMHDDDAQRQIQKIDFAIGSALSVAGEQSVAGLEAPTGGKNYRRNS